MILILTEPRDVHADQVEKKLRERGAELVRFDPAQVPSRAAISLAYSATGQARYTLHVGAESVALNRVTAVWYRRPGNPTPHAELADGPGRAFAEQECQTLLRDAWNCLECFWLPGPFAVLQRAQLKAWQLQAAGALGFELPPTLVTNSPAEFLDFHRRHNGNIISKLNGNAFFHAIGPAFQRYTEVVSKRDVGYARAIRYCPAIFQAYVPKRLELRITVVGRQVFAAEIHSQESNHTRHDWRRYDFNSTRYLSHALPRDLERRCLQLTERLDLCYGAIDMVLTPDGRYVFLEINPGGQYMWVEMATGLPISDAICDLLLSAAAGKAWPTTRASPPWGEPR
jgi:hypothetical protein